MSIALSRKSILSFGLTIDNVADLKQYSGASLKHETREMR